jgi:hypothetical protein
LRELEAKGITPESQDTSKLVKLKIKLQ